MTAGICAKLLKKAMPTPYYSNSFSQAEAKASLQNCVLQNDVCNSKRVLSSIPVQPELLTLTHDRQADVTPRGCYSSCDPKGMSNCCSKRPSNFVADHNVSQLVTDHSASQLIAE